MPHPIWGYQTIPVFCLKNLNAKGKGEINMEKNRMEFVKQCGELLRIAKPHLKQCELVLGKDIDPKTHESVFAPDGEYVIVSCENGYRYTINVTCNSLADIAKAIFTDMAYK